MQLIDITHAQTQLPQLMQIALQGEEIIITRNNQPILKLSHKSNILHTQKKTKRQRQRTNQNRARL